MTKSERDARDAADFRLIERKRLDVYHDVRKWCVEDVGADFRQARTLHAALNKLRKARGWK